MAFKSFVLSQAAWLQRVLGPSALRALAARAEQLTKEGPSRGGSCLIA